MYEISTSKYLYLHIVLSIYFRVVNLTMAIWWPKHVVVNSFPPRYLTKHLVVFMTVVLHLFLHCTWPTYSIPESFQTIFFSVTVSVYYSWYLLQCIPVATAYIKPVSPNIFCLELCKHSPSLFLNWADVMKISFPLLSAWASEKCSHSNSHGDAGCRWCRIRIIPLLARNSWMDNSKWTGPLSWWWSLFPVCHFSHQSFCTSYHKCCRTCAQKCWHTVTVEQIRDAQFMYVGEKNLAHTLHWHKLSSLLLCFFNISKVSVRVLCSFKKNLMHMCCPLVSACYFTVT